MLSLRKARPQDSAAIALLNKNEMGYDCSPEKTEEILVKLLTNRAHFIAVAESDGAVVGYVHAADYDLTYAPPLKNIMGIAVSSAYRGNGAGKQLMEAVERWAVESGTAGVRLVSGASRTGAHSFYAACGYTMSKDQKNFKKIFSGTAP